MPSEREPDPDGTDPDGTDPDGKDPDGTDPEGSDESNEADMDPMSEERPVPLVPPMRLSRVLMASISARKMWGISNYWKALRNNG